MIFGAIIGIANIIPGVSGGTMAVVLNVYDRLIYAISSLRKEWRRHLPFLICIFIGAGFGIIVFSRVIKSLLASYPMQLNLFFVGLIVGSVPLIFRKVRISKPPKLAKGVAFLVFFGLMIALSFVQKDGTVTTLETSFHMTLALRLFWHATIASAAMILPGVSGSLVLVILGSYFTILTAIADFNILLLVPVGLGVIVGIVGGSKLIAILLKRYEGVTFSGILGLVFGSLFPVLIQSGFGFGREGYVWALLCFLVGTGIALAFGRFATTTN